MALYRWGEDLTPLPRPATELHIPVPPRGSVQDLIFTEDQGKAMQSFLCTHCLSSVNNYL